MRDPLNAALSDFHRTKSGSDRHVSHADRKYFDARWRQFALKYVSRWKWFFEVMMKRYSTQNICVIQYEKLTQNVLKELRPCLKIIMEHEISKERENCILKEQEGKYHRPSMKPNDLNYVMNLTFSEEELMNFKLIRENIIERLND